MKKKNLPDIKQFKEEHLLLKKEFSRKAMDLDKKNQELAMEVSLEVIREVAMAMNKPEDMLDICKAICGELQKLGVTEIRNIQTAIIDKEKEVYNNYEYFRKGKKKFITEVAYKKQKDVQAFVNRMAKDPNGFFTRTFKGAKLKQWIRYQASAGQYIDPGTKATSSLHYYFYSIGPGALGISSYAPLSNKVIGMFKRFRNVFKLAYSRYLAIEQALETAREANIQASLEKIRATAMAMNKPEDILTICETMYREFQSLGFPSLRNAMINIHNDEMRTFINYDYSDELGRSTNHLRYDIHPVIQKQVRQMRKADDAFSETVFEGSDLASWKKFRKEIGEKEDARIKKSKGLYYYFYSIGSGSIGISTFEPVNEEKLQLLKRFRNVFHLSYQRYTDVKQAEEQAREARIETALERVRAVAMAMRKPDDLMEICKVVFAELKALEFSEIRNTLIDTFVDEEKYFIDYDYSEFTGGTSSKIPYSGNPVVEKYIKDIRRSGDAFSEIAVEGKQLLEWKKFRRANGEMEDPRLDNLKVLYYYKYSIGSGGIGISTYSRISSEKQDILHRFRNVFNLAYQRYTDIAQAEAQALEAQIEAALERVRSRTMAMHKTSELQEVIHTVHQELLKLDLSIDGGSFVVINEDLKDELRCWGSGGTATTSTEVRVPHFDMPFVLNLINGIKKGPGFFSELFTRKEKKTFFFRLFKHKPWSEISKEEKKMTLSAPGGYTRSVAVSKHSTVFVINQEGKIFTEEENEILKRFGKVFEQSYTRFLDLQKAEEQAWEAQIEAALERVRSRTMAMQRSEELLEVASVLFQQVKSLGVPQWNCGFNIWNIGDDKFTYYPGSPDGIISPSPCKIPLNEHPVFMRFDESRKRGDELLVYEKKGKEQAGHYQYMLSLPGVGDLLQSMLDAGFKLPTFQIDHLANFAYGNLIFITYEHFPKMHDVFKRFAKVFEQTYTRFLDLQKAEAQAREARIETALEAVRTSSMAMHQSDQLEKVVTTLSKKLVELKVSFDGALIFFFDKEKRNCNVWISTTQLPDPVKIHIPSETEIPGNEILDNLWKAIDTGEEFINQTYSGKTKNDYFRCVAKKNKGKIPDFVTKMQVKAPSWTISFVPGTNSVIGIDSWSGQTLAPEDFQVLKRFGLVFEQAYTRFLDLQKAEAQSREAEIQLALERVRSRSLAMHHTSELQEVVTIVAQQLHAMNIDINGGVFITINEEVDKDIPLWASAGAADYVQKAITPFLGKPFYIRMAEAIKKRNNFYTEELSREEKVQLFEHLFQFPPWNDLPVKRKKELLSREGGLCRSIAINEHTSIAMTDHFGRKFSDEENQILIRFGKVLEQSYTRFLDLQKAEAQAREGQIELGLERVRTRAMAMQNSDELKELIGTVFTELTKLDLALTRCIIWVFDPETSSARWWMANSEEPSNPMSFYVKYHEHPAYLTFVNAWKNQNSKFVYDLNGKDKIEWDNFIFTETELKNLPSIVKKGMRAPERVLLSASFNNFGGINVASLEPLSEAHFDILLRFAKVFDLTYTRFNDLIKAEEQTREAKIESALERIRARALAMHESGELIEVAKVLREQMGLLGQPELETSAVQLYEEDPDNIISFRAFRLSSVKEGEIIYSRSLIPKTCCLLVKEMLQHFYAAESDFTIEVSGKKQADWYKELFKIAPEVEIAMKMNNSIREKRYYHFSKFSGGALLMAASQVPSRETCQLQKRAARVFDLAYQRFLDLKNAEAQAREAQIQLAMERVRARTMAMQSSRELPEAANLLFQQVQSLGMPAWSAGYCTWEDDNKETIKLSMCSEGVLQPTLKMPLTEDPTLIHFREGALNGETLFVEEVGGSILKKHYAYLKTLPGVKETLDDIEKAGFPLPTFQINHCAYYSKGFLLFITYEPVPEAHDIFRRFGNVFEQTYTRFLDLQRSEAQTREAQIEAALERVRSRAMAMHTSAELSEAAILLYEQLRSVGICEFFNCGYVLVNEEENIQETWMTDPDGGIRLGHDMPLTGDAVMDERYKSWKRKDPVFSQQLGGDKLRKHLEFVSTLEISGSNSLPDLPDPTVFYCSHFSHGYLHLLAKDKLNKEAENILSRFSNVFEIAFRRFLDLEKAEAQAREAKIEAALEKVRGRTMAMQHSAELGEAASLLFSQLKELGIDAWTCGYNIWNEDKTAVTAWLSGGKMQPSFYYPLTENPTLKHFYDAALRGESLFVEEVKGEELVELYRDLGTYRKLEEQRGVTMEPRPAPPVYQVNHAAYFSYGYLLIVTYKPYPKAHDIFKRFAAVFEQTYTRFLDLQKAEAQAREAQIEVALERVRSRTMAMQKSEELADTAWILFEQLKELGEQPERAFIGIIDEKERVIEIWATRHGGLFLNQAWKASIDEPYVMRPMFNAWKEEKRSLVIELKEESLEGYFQFLVSLGAPVSREIFGDIRFENIAFFSRGMLGIITPEPRSTGAIQLYERFAGVFDLTYTRFLDLKNAEAQAREAVKQASLDRIRAEIASMRTIADLDRITPLIWKELHILGLPFIRCGVFMMDDQQALMHTFLSTPNGDAIAAFHLPYDTPGNIAQILQHWQKKKLFVDHWDESAFSAWTEILVQKGALDAQNNYLSSFPEGGFYLHFVPFLQGMLYLGNVAQLNDTEIELLQSVADAFSTAYARYEDFNKLEIAKQQVENTLTELRQAQQQLVQSEKMASLGELTAGIAHEIQNPLNFVNNFSEVSIELLDEMRTELGSGNLEEAKEIANDVIQNLEKINHHGKRADSIVKGMLQHSRSSSGQKERTDINALCDEFLRLSYHGLRAKDKSFNAVLKTDFDPSVGSINIVPQDLGRVILNMITNAFYAVDQKKHSGISHYDPIVSLTTKRINESVLISIKDNGNGIPSKVLDKIFQPFFTTKPTGQGTGLGLSLSYDIVKAHGGNIKVETREGEGTEFIIQLLNN